MKRLSLVAALALVACGDGPVEPPEAALYYQRALEAKDAGDQQKYLEILRRLSDSYEDSKYGRRAALLLAVPAYAGEKSPEAATAAQYRDFREKIRALGIRQTLRQLYEAEKRHFTTPRVGLFEEPLPARFLAAGPTPAEVPKGRAVLPPPPGFADPSWEALGFSTAGPTRYQFTVLTQGEGPGAKLILRALGDLDGDGVYSVYELHAEADSSNNVTSQGDILVRDENE